MPNPSPYSNNGPYDFSAEDSENSDEGYYGRQELVDDMYADRQLLFKEIRRKEKTEEDIDDRMNDISVRVRFSNKQGLRVWKFFSKFASFTHFLIATRRSGQDVDWSPGGISSSIEYVEMAINYTQGGKKWLGWLAKYPTLRYNAV